MKPFIQEKAGVSFYGKAPVSLAIRKNYIEYIYRISPELYGLINLVINSDGLLFIADCGSFFLRLYKILPELTLSRSELPLLFGLLRGENGEYFIGIAGKNKSRSEMSRGIMYKESYDPSDELPFTIAGKQENIDKAFRLLMFTQKLFIEISNSKQPKLKELLPYFTE